MGPRPIFYCQYAPAYRCSFRRGRRPRRPARYTMAFSINRRGVEDAAPYTRPTDTRRTPAPPLGVVPRRGPRPPHGRLGRGRNVKKTCRCRHVKKTCRWHVFSVDLSGYAAVASILVCTALPFSSDRGGCAAAASILSLKVPPSPRRPICSRPPITPS